MSSSCIVNDGSTVNQYRCTDANLSCLLSDLLDGKFPVIIGHPESFDTPLGRRILKELQRRGMVILLCIDEFHQSDDGHWGSFRPDMLKSSTALRLYGIKDCPSISMTATATEEEVLTVIKALGLRSSPVVLASSPIQSHIKFSVVRRPSNNHGLDGTVNAKGVRKPGLMDLLERIFLRRYLGNKIGLLLCKSHIDLRLLLRLI